MSNALRRGRTLNPGAVKLAKRWQEKRIKDLKDKLQNGTITMEERHELVWKWG